MSADAAAADAVAGADQFENVWDRFDEIWASGRNFDALNLPLLSYVMLIKAHAAKWANFFVDHLAPIFGISFSYNSSEWLEDLIYRRTRRGSSMI